MSKNTKKPFLISRMDIRYISVCFYLVILNKVKLKMVLNVWRRLDLRQNGDTFGIHATCAAINRLWLMINEFWVIVNHLQPGHAAFWGPLCYLWNCRLYSIIVVMLCIVHAHCGQHQYLLRPLGFSESSFIPTATPDRSRHDEGKAV